jgi:hypothetical protein
MMLLLHFSSALRHYADWANMTAAFEPDSPYFKANGATTETAGDGQPQPESALGQEHRDQQDRQDTPQQDQQQRQPPQEPQVGSIRAETPVLVGMSYLLLPNETLAS